MMKIVLSKALCPEGMALLGGADLFVADDGNPHHYLSAMQTADAYILRIGKIDREIIEQSTNLKVIGRTGVGYDNVDMAAATETGIPVVITPGANSRSVAEHTIALMFALSKNLLEGHLETINGHFTTIRDSGRMFELKGKTAGIIGLGAIGREVAKICQALGMSVIGYDPYLSREQIEMLGCVYCENYEDLLPLADFLTLHLPLTKETRGMIRQPQLQKMKRTSVLINCARGGIVDESDLAAALNGDVIAGAGTDVFGEEPPAINNPLLQARHLLISPHSASLTREAMINMSVMCAEGCLAVLRGERWPHVVNPEAWQHPRWIGRD